MSIFSSWIVKFLMQTTTKSMNSKRFQNFISKRNIDAQSHSQGCVRFTADCEKYSNGRVLKIVSRKTNGNKKLARKKKNPQIHHNTDGENRCQKINILQLQTLFALSACSAAS